MRRGVQIVAATLLALLLLLPAVLLGTSSGARWALQLAGAYLPVAARGVSGSLWRGLELQYVRYDGAGLQLRAEQLAFTPRWRCALQSVVCIERLEAQRLLLQVPAAEDDAQTTLPRELPLAGLPRVDVDALQIGELVLQRGPNTQVFRQLDVAAELGPRRVLLSRFAVEHDLGAVSASARLRRRGEWTLEAQLMLADGLQPGTALSVPRDLALIASGDLRTLRASVDSAGGSALEVEVSFDEAAQRISAEGTLSGLEALVPGLSAQPWTQLSGPLRFVVAADPQAQRLELEQALAGYAPEPLPLFLNLRGEAGIWTLAEGRLGERAGPRLRALGELGALDALAPKLQLVLLDFAPPAAAELPVQGVTGTVGVGFAVSDPLTSWTLRSKRLQVVESESSWELSLDLAADGETLFPLGKASGLRDGLPFSYVRVADGEGRARLSLPEGLQLGEYALSEVSLAVLPGEPLAAELALRGDIEGALSLGIARTASGADLRLEPLELSILGEMVSSTEAVIGRWDQGARSLQLEALCLRWRRNGACGERMQLGERGTLTLDLSVDERYQGAVADKPFTLRALGGGQLALAWAPGGLQSAGLDMDFSELSLDPYASTGTAAPIRWEQAIGRLRWSPGDLALDLTLDSDSLGDATVVLGERGGVLDGSVDIVALDLGALNDLLPEWSLTGGRLSSALRIAGRRAQPELYGSLVIDGLNAQLPGVDTALRDARLAVDARGQQLALQGEAQFGGAPLRLEGVCCNDGALVATLNGDHNRVTLPVGLDATVTPALGIRVDPQNLTVDGLLTVHDGVFAHSGPLNGGVALSEDVIRIDQPPQPRRRFTLNAQLRTLIEPGFTLRSRQLLATLAGDLRLDLRPEQPPALSGNLQVLGGELRALGQALRLTEGVVGFVGDPLNPELSLSAEREIRAERLRVGFQVRGSLEEPTLELFSDPQRSERETLSYLLRGRGPDVGASADSTAMALSLGASAINQTGLLSAFNEIPGLSGVTLGAEGSDEDMAATVSAYVGNRLFISYGLGIYEPVNALTVRLYLRSRLWLEVVSRLESSLDLYYRFDLD